MGLLIPRKHSRALGFLFFFLLVFPILSYPGPRTILEVVTGEGASRSPNSERELPSIVSETMTLKRALSLGTFLFLSSVHMDPHAVLIAEVASRPQ